MDVNHNHQVDRELFVFNDGGIGGIDWTVGRPEISCKKPILLVYPGLSGGNSNWYALGLIHEARKRGIICGTLLYRGTENLPLTSPQFNVSS